MRIDLFLTRSRLVKRRGLAQALIEAGGVRVGGVPVKSGRKLAEGDEIEITLGAPPKDRDAVARCEEAGVDRLIVRPWRRSPEAIDGLRAFADRFF